MTSFTRDDPRTSDARAGADRAGADRAGAVPDASAVPAVRSGGHRRRTPRGVTLLVRASTFAVLGVFVLVLLAVVGVPVVAGAQTYTVLTGSMRPDLPEGTVVVVREAPVDTIRVGDVLTYQLRPDRPEVVTHRVVAARTVGGEPRWRTQGDANDVRDRGWVRPVQVRGELWYSVPVVGYAGRVLGPETRELAVRGAGLALLLYGVLAVARSLGARGPRTSTPLAGHRDA